VSRSSRLHRAFLALLLALVALASAGSTPSVAERPNGAGLVIRFGDGRIVTAYVEFAEPAITGIELLQRAGIPVTVAQFGGLGLAVCAIAGEGCPAQDCFCQAKSQPAWFWHYYGLTPDGRWVLHPVGASNRLLRDGDVDGWSWTAGESGLPAITIDDIARAHGVERQPTASPTAPPPSPTPLPPLTPTPIVSQAPTPATPETSPTVPAPATVSIAASPAVASPEPVTSPVPSTSAVPTPTPYRVASPAPPPTPTSAPTPLPTATPLPTGSSSGPPWTAIAFLGLAAAFALVVLIARLRDYRP